MGTGEHMWLCLLSRRASAHSAAAIEHIGSPDTSPCFTKSDTDVLSISICFVRAVSGSFDLGRCSIAERAYSSGVRLCDL